MALTPEDWVRYSTIAQGVSAVAMLGFAGVQLWLTHKQECSRRNERALDERAKTVDRGRDADVAFQIVWSEHFRLESLAAEFAQEDLVLLSALGALPPQDLLPRDWTAIATRLAQLSVEAGYLGGVALTLAHDISRQVAKLNGIVHSFRTQYAGYGAEQIAKLVRDNRLGESNPLEAGIRKGTADLARLMWDAVSHSPSSAQIRTLTFKDDLSSEFGKRAVSELQMRSKEQPRS